ncbi:MULTISPECIES: Panacea domain-containing protein [Rhizobium]|uniref:Panacea domain-containing protein n=1 Tax=Rhizobium TaxID=379 RepID=UPI001C9157A5|nr:MULTISPECIES: Panacea domain-containing protein [Rhizobium]MBY3247443.1 SocA family protein [Rhizobium laguerreae]MBY5388480.1 SocA family protein [Rhizobium leguminosarum]
MTYVPNIPDWFLTRKAAQVTAFFALKSGGEINILKATKLIYLADRLSMERRDFPITNDTYVSMKFGPVNSYTYSYMNGAAPTRQEDWLEFISPRHHENLMLSQQVEIGDLDELSRGDIRLLEETWGKFKDIDRFALADWTHEFCPEWKDPAGSSIPIELARIFQVLEKNDPVDLAEDLQTERRMVAAFRAA